MKFSIKNAYVFNNNTFIKQSFTVCDNRILPFNDGEDCRIYDCDGLYVFPGFVDVHVHLREPGFSYKETIKSGTAAALKSGYNTVCTMPNLKPVPDSLDNLNVQLELIEKGAKCNVLPFGSITVNEAGEVLADMEAMAPHVVGFSDDGKGVQSSEMMKEAMVKAKSLSKIISAHCEENSLLNGGVIHDGQFAKENNIPGICSQSEYLPILRDIDLAKETGVSYHVCHISAKESVEAIRQAKNDGVDITCETAPHYLVMNDMDIKDDGRFKMNPPIRSEADRLALIEGIKDGTIDMIATDHAPHSADEKSKGLRGSNMGVVGLETAFPVLYTYLVKNNIICLEKLIELMSINPAKRFLDSFDGVNFCIYDLSKEYTVCPDNFISMGKSSPFEGIKVFGKCIGNIIDGEMKFFEN